MPKMTRERQTSLMAWEAVVVGRPDVMCSTPEFEPAPKTARRVPPRHPGRNLAKDGRMWALSVRNAELVFLKDGADRLRKGTMGNSTLRGDRGTERGGLTTTATPVAGEIAEHRFVPELPRPIEHRGEPAGGVFGGAAPHEQRETGDTPNLPQIQTELRHRPQRVELCARQTF